jgi:hypothetical protein
MRIKHLTVLVVAMLFAISAQARDYYVDITNQTGFTIFDLHVSPAGQIPGRGCAGQ